MSSVGARYGGALSQDTVTVFCIVPRKVRLEIVRAFCGRIKRPESEDANLSV